MAVEYSKEELLEKQAKMKATRERMKKENALDFSPLDSLFYVKIDRQNQEESLVYGLGYEVPIEGELFPVEWTEDNGNTETY